MRIVQRENATILKFKYLAKNYSVYKKMQSDFGVL